MIDTDVLLVRKALEARENAYVPYSKFRVGAALLAEDGEIFTGCNIENASYSLTCCAERVAIFKAISHGRRKFKAIAVVSDSPEVIFPCGACRQVISEFCIPRVIVGNINGDYKTFAAAELLPNAFTFSDLPLERGVED